MLLGLDNERIWIELVFIDNCIYQRDHFPEEYIMALFSFHIQNKTKSPPKVKILQMSNLICKLLTQDLYVQNISYLTVDVLQTSSVIFSHQFPLAWHA